MGKVKDLTGQIFGRWSVLRQVEPERRRSGDRAAYWLCRCSCAEQTERVVVSGNLVRGSSLSCGCLKDELGSQRMLENLAGQTFGRLLVLERVDRKSNRTWWRCRCACEAEIVMRADSLKRGAEPSCGCALRISADVKSRRCYLCRESKPASEFSRNRARPAGIHSVCKECTAGLEFERRLRRYDLTSEEYVQMLETQGGLCAICQRSPRENKSLAIDHDHTTGRVRGLLCDPCNLALGSFQDDVDTLLRAVEYLRPGVS